MATEKPQPSEYAPFYADYIATVPDGDIVQLLEQQVATLRAFAGRVAPERDMFRYAPGKWTVRELAGHLTDAERVFGYRLVCISRGDRTSFPGFDENEYVAAANFNARPLQSLVEEFALLRGGNVIAMRAFDAAAWQRVGLANNHPVSVRALAYIMAGHVYHHLDMLRTRYGL